MRGFFIVLIRADVSDVRIRQADDLPGITWICENFLIPGKAGIENDFAAAARDRPRSSPVKYAPVFQREDCRSVLNFRQWSLRESWLFFFGLGRGRQRTEMVHRPVREHGPAVDRPAGNRAEHA